MQNETRNEEEVPLSSRFSEVDNRTDYKMNYLQEQMGLSGKPPPRYIIRGSHPWRIRWELFIIVLALYNSISVPLGVAFETNNANIGYEVFERLVDCFFAIDLIVNFFCTYTDKNGEEIYDLKEIGKNYIMTGRFFIDLAATIPFELLPEIFGANSSSKSLQLFQIMKMVRLLRLRRIVSYLRLRNDFKLAIRIAVIVFNLLLFCHLIACFWYLLVSVEKDWKPPKDLEGAQDKYYKDSELLYNYSTSLYYAILIMMGFDCLPATTYEALYAAAVMIAGSIVTAALFGHVTLLLQSMNRKTANFHEQLDTANQAMANIGLGLELQTRILDYISYTYANKDQQNELNLFFNMLSPALRLEVSITLFREVLSKSPAFNHQPEIAEFLIVHLTTILCKPETSVIRRGEAGDFVYLISRGSVKVITLNENLEDECLSILEESQYFGEIALLTDTHRTATVETNNYTTLARLGREHFKEMLKRSTSLTKAFMEKLHNYPDKWQAYLIKMLRSIPYFRKCSNEELSSLAYILKPKQYEAGSIIVKHNEAINSILLVASGKIHITTEFKGSQVVLLEVGKEGVLFVNSALQTYSQAFTVQVAETSLLLLLDEESLKSQCRIFPNLSARVVGHKSRYGLEEIPRKSDMYLSQTQITPLMKLKLATMRIMIGKRQMRQKSLSYKIQQLVLTIKKMIQEQKKVNQEYEALDFNNYSDILKKVLKTTEEMSQKCDILNENMRMNSSKVEHIRLRVSN